MLYFDLVREGCLKAQVACLAWCPMDNHVHLVLVPQRKRVCATPWARRTGAIAGRSTSAMAGVVICSRAGLRAIRWTTRI